MNHRHLQAATVLALGVTVLAGCTSQEIAGEAPSSAVASVSTPAAEPTTVQNVTVPDVTGKDAESARSVLVAAGFAVDTTGDGTVANGTTPGAGALVAPGSKVTVILVKPEADGTRENPFPAGTT